MKSIQVSTKEESKSCWEQQPIRVIPYYRSRGARGIVFQTRRRNTSARRQRIVSYIVEILRPTDIIYNAEFHQSVFEIKNTMAL